MQRAAFADIELEYELHGAGEPVVLVHPGVFADWLTPLLREPALADRYCLVHYHRVGCAGSSRVAGPVSIAEQAAQCRGLMRELGIDRAHIVGHSSSALVALQLALDFPEAVHTLAALEPALTDVPSAAQRARFIVPAIESYRAGDRAAAVGTFLSGTCGPGYRAVLDAELPGAFDQHVADADTFFEQEFPALQQWSFTRAYASRITQPVLAVLGTESRELDPIWGERHELLLEWLPNVEEFLVPGATHLLQVQSPQTVSAGLAAFFSRHPFDAEHG
jgi:pimeloyl-ACP methyl ester carboxylesterase